MTLVMAAISLNLVLRWPPKAFDLWTWGIKARHCVRPWPFITFCNLLPPSWWGCVLNGSPIIRMFPHIIDIGSPKLLLQEEARCIFDICVSHGSSIKPEWVPRASNEQADYLSRIRELKHEDISRRRRRQ